MTDNNQSSVYEGRVERGMPTSSVANAGAAYPSALLEQFHRS